MNSIEVILKNIQLRNNILPDELKELKNDLNNSFKVNNQQAGVITPGYFSYFIPILEKYKLSKIITRYQISEEQYTNGYSGKIVKIPVVDVFIPENTSTTRLFIID